MSEIPADTIEQSGASTSVATFVMSDVVGSTRLWEQYPEHMHSVIKEHDRIFYEIISANSGEVIKSRGEGDSVFAVFQSPVNAVHAASQLQIALAEFPWPGNIELSVRMAIHTGGAEYRDKDYYGPVVNRCARLRATAHGRQIILSDSTREMIHNYLPKEITLKNLGVHRLKDLQQPEQVWQVCHPGLQDEFPPLNSLNIRQNNLPSQISSFIGREGDIATLQSILRSSRMCTVVGTGGVGKSRLCLQTAVEIVDQFQDGVWLIELAPHSDERHVLNLIAATLQIKEESDTTLQNSILSALANKQLLLIIDNCEHLISECARVINLLLRACPSIKILANSREALGISGEKLFRIPSLSLPSENTLLLASDLEKFEAPKLFLERVRSTQPNFTYTDTQANAIAEICRNLDGIPFAIELAAARVRAMSIDQLSVRLSDRFRILTGGNKNSLPRQQTLRALIDWSYNLLTYTEKKLLNRLSVFAGGWYLEDAETICACDDIDSWDIVDLLTSLVDKSLVVFDDSTSMSRYRLLQSVRQYGLQKLVEEGEDDQIHLAHSEHYENKAKSWNRAIDQFGEAQQSALHGMQTDIGNLLAGMDWACAAGKQELVIEYGLDLARYFLIQGRFLEGDTRLELAEVAARETGSTVNLIQLLNQRGRLAWQRSDLSGARKYYSEGLAISIEAGNFERTISLINNIANIYWAERDLVSAAEKYEEAMRISETHNIDKYKGAILANLGVLYSEQEDFAKANKYLEEAIAVHKKSDNARAYADAISNLGESYQVQKRYEEAIVRFHEALEIYKQMGMRNGIALCYTNLGTAYIEMNELDKADEWISASITLSREINYTWTLAPSIAAEGRLLFLRGNLTDGLNKIKEALEISELESGGNIIISFRILKSLMDTLLVLNKYKAAYFVYKVIADSFSSNLSPVDRSSLASSIEFPLESQDAEFGDLEKMPEDTILSQVIMRVSSLL